MWAQASSPTRFPIGGLILTLLSVGQEAVRPEEEAAGHICWGGGSWPGRPDEGMVLASGAADLSHRLRWDSTQAADAQKCCFWSKSVLAHSS